jgi:inner membrane protein YidH
MHVMGDDASTRDRLAVERTVLANERTLLAYVRTALAFVISGASAIHFLDSSPARVVGWVGLVAGVVTGVIGTARFVRTRRQLAAPADPDAPGRR